MSGGNEQRFANMLAELRARPLPKRFYKEAGVAGDAMLRSPSPSTGGR